MRREKAAPFNLQHGKLFFQIEPRHIMWLLRASSRGNAVPKMQACKNEALSSSAAFAVL